MESWEFRSEQYKHISIFLSMSQILSPWLPQQNMIIHEREEAKMGEKGNKPHYDSLSQQKTFEI